MKSTLKYFAAAFAIVAAAACSKEHNDDLGIELETKYLTISASHESQTKTLLGVDNWANWSDEDAICLFYKDNKYGDLYMNDDVLTIDPTSNDSDPTKAIFSGNATVAKNYYAAYPSSGWQAKSNLYLEFQGLNSQVATKNSFDPQKHIALSVNSKDNHFFFQNACALLKVTVGFDNVYSIKVDGSISDDIGFGIPFTFRPGELDINGFSYYIGNYNPTITLSNADPTIPLENGATYYIVVPHTTVSDFKVSLSDENGNIIYSKKKASNFTIERNKIYDLGILKKEPPKVGDYFYSNGTYSAELDKSKTVAGVIIFTGNPKEKFNDSALPDQYCNGLVISTSSRKCAWNSTQLSSIPASVKLSGSTSAIADFSMGGYTATQAFGTNNYTVFANGAAPDGTSGWYLGAANEWKYILANKDTINKSLEGVGDAINPSQKSESFWLPYFYSTRAAIVYISGGAPYFYYEQYYYRPDLSSYCYNARPIFAF